jgi:hypothetical protein
MLWHGTSARSKPRNAFAEMTTAVRCANSTEQRLRPCTDRHKLVQWGQHYVSRFHVSRTPLRNCPFMGTRRRCAEHESVPVVHRISKSLPSQTPSKHAASILATATIRTWHCDGSSVLCAGRPCIRVPARSRSSCGRTCRAGLLPARSERYTTRLLLRKPSMS